MSELAGKGALLSLTFLQRRHLGVKLVTSCSTDIYFFTKVTFIKLRVLFA